MFILFPSVKHPSPRKKSSSSGFTRRLLSLSVNGRTLTATEIEDCLIPEEYVFVDADVDVFESITFIRLVKGVVLVIVRKGYV